MDQVATDMAGTAGDWPYPDAANPDLLDRIPVNARVVLDVGCGMGALGALYKRINPRAKVLGIESNAAAARVAATRLDQVAVVDVEQTPVPFALPGGVDCLIYGDVLEHIRDPWALIRAQSELLSPNGVLLTCVPNVEHWSMISRLLAEGWEYEQTGLLDRHHLRWFTRKTMERALTEAGLVPLDVAGRVFDAERGRAFIGKLAPALQALGVDVQAYATRAAPLQYVWRASRQALPVLNVLSTMLEPVGGVSQVRVVDPLRALGTDPTVRTRLWDGKPPAPGERGEPRILIFHRPALTGEVGLARLKEVISPDVVVVTEFDDHPDYIPILQRKDVYNFRAVHAVQTTTRKLAEVLGAQNPEIAVFPNGVRMLPPVRNFAELPVMTLFFGSLNREEEWPPYIQALNAAIAAVGDRLRFEIVHDRGLFEALQTTRKSFTPMCDYATYMNLLGRSEISFMPLSDNPFNHSKSDLKFIEAASCRAAALASPVVYGESIQDGRTGVLFRDAEELRQKLLAMVANPGAVRAMGDAARDWVTQHRMLAYQVGQRIAWYRSLWERRRELHAKLLERVPELAR